MKFKNLTKEQIIISIDRLTRFKPTEEKYLRVFRDILTHSLIEPKYKKSQLEELDYTEIRDMATEILNNSINYLTPPLSSKGDGADKISMEENYVRSTSSKGEGVEKINKIIKEYENSVFTINKGAQELLNNNINYSDAIKLVEEDCPINLLWLKNLCNPEVNIKNLVDIREKEGLKFPIEKVVIVEGLTEEILLPEFSRLLGYDFNQKGIQLIPAGGKNQVVKLYYEFAEQLRIPVFLLLDKDAEENIAQIMPKLRECDKIHLVSCGEFEDLLPKSLIVKTVNNHLNNFASITINELDNSISEVENLENIFKEKGLHEFKKAEFAKLVKENISTLDDVSEEIKVIVREMVSLKDIERRRC